MKIEIDEEVKPTGDGSRSERQVAGLMQFDVGKRNYGVIAGRLGYIVTNNEFCYQVRSLNENIELGANWTFEGEPYEFRVMTLAEILAAARPITSYQEWGHYWGIKGRIGRNYEDMARHAHELGADISTMPEWGEEVAQEQSAGEGK